MKIQKRYYKEIRELAERLVLEQQNEHISHKADLDSVHERIKRDRIDEIDIK